MHNTLIHTKLRQGILAAILIAAVAVAAGHTHTIFAATGACSTQPGYPTNNDYGSVTSAVNVTGAGTYRVWSRLAAPDTTNNTYMLEIDGNSCYTIGGSTIPTYASGATNFFVSGSSNWTSKTTAGTQIDVNLTVGSHTLKLIGTAPGVVIDRVVFTQDTACVPTGTGDNCANPPDTTAPTGVVITSPANGASISTTTNVTATATDDVAMQKVEFYVDDVLKATDTATPYTYSLSPTGLSVGTHRLYVTAYDTSNNSTTSTTVNFTVPDTTPPTISNVSVGTTTQNSAPVSWTTNEAADSQVKYGPTTSYGSTTTLNATLVTNHSVTVTGLTASTTYHYQVVSKDAAGNTTTSPDATFTTAAPAGDTTPPTISITTPASGATVSGTAITISANASDNVGVVGVQFQVKGSNVGTEDTVAPYSTSWSLAGLANGSYVVTAIARDAAGNTQTATITVTLSNTFAAADINQNGYVNYCDLSILASNYGKSGSAITNPRANIINSDGLNIVNYLDLSALASAYTNSGPC